MIRFSALKDAFGGEEVSDSVEISIVVNIHTQTVRLVAVYGRGRMVESGWLMAPWSGAARARL